jgi:hypothetical protein
LGADLNNAAKQRKPEERSSSRADAWPLPRDREARNLARGPRRQGSEHLWRTSSPHRKPIQSGVGQDEPYRTQYGAAQAAPDHDMARRGIELIPLEAIFGRLQPALLAGDPVPEPLSLEHLTRGDCELDNKLIRCGLNRVSQNAWSNRNLRLDAVAAELADQIWGEGAVGLQFWFLSVYTHTPSGTRA